MTERKYYKKVPKFQRVRRLERERKRDTGFYFYGPSNTYVGGGFGWGPLDEC